MKYTIEIMNEIYAKSKRALILRYVMKSVNIFTRKIRSFWEIL